MARKLTQENEKKMKFATELMKSGMTRKDLGAKVKAKFGSILPARLMDKVFTPKMMFSAVGATSGRLSSKGEPQLANKPKTAGSIRLPKGAKVIDVGLKAAWKHVEAHSALEVYSPSESMVAALRQLRLQMAMDNVASLELNEQGDVNVIMRRAGYAKL